MQSRQDVLCRPSRIRPSSYRTLTFYPSASHRSSYSPSPFLANYRKSFSSEPAKSSRFPVKTYHLAPSARRKRLRQTCDDNVLEDLSDISVRSKQIQSDNSFQSNACLNRKREFSYKRPSCNRTSSNENEQIHSSSSCNIRHSSSERCSSEDHGTPCSSEFEEEVYHPFEKYSRRDCDEDWRDDEEVDRLNHDQDHDRETLEDRYAFNKKDDDLEIGTAYDSDSDDMDDDDDAVNDRKEDSNKTDRTLHDSDSDNSKDKQILYSSENKTKHGWNSEEERETSNKNVNKGDSGMQNQNGRLKTSRNDDTSASEDESKRSIRSNKPDETKCQEWKSSDNKTDCTVERKEEGEKEDDRDAARNRHDNAMSGDAEERKDSFQFTLNSTSSRKSTTSAAVQTDLSDDDMEKPSKQRCCTDQPYEKNRKTRRRRMKLNHRLCEEIFPKTTRCGNAKTHKQRPITAEISVRSLKTSNSSPSTVKLQVKLRTKSRIKRRSPEQLRHKVTLYQVQCKKDRFITPREKIVTKYLLTSSDSLPNVPKKKVKKRDAYLSRFEKEWAEEELAFKRSGRRGSTKYLGRLSSSCDSLPSVQKKKVKKRNDYLRRFEKEWAEVETAFNKRRSTRYLDDL